MTVTIVENWLKKLSEIFDSLIFWPMNFKFTCHFGWCILKILKFFRSKYVDGINVVILFSCICYKQLVIKLEDISFRNVCNKLKSSARNGLSQFLIWRVLYQPRMNTPLTVPLWLMCTASFWWNINGRVTVVEN